MPPDNRTDNLEELLALEAQPILLVRLRFLLLLHNPNTNLNCVFEVFYHGLLVVGSPAGRCRVRHVSAGP
ncbi:MAG: hypothetical protein P8R42_27165 [Candidatus Binatia bacterium]|nr:hypothetical protein [Candidatus Binatia bacterium]